MNNVLEPNTIPLLARQAILDVQENLVGYELLFRDENGKAQFSSSTQATAAVIQQWMTRGVTQSNELTFINTDEKILTLNFFDNIDPKNFVLEILETSKISADFIERVRALKSRGFKIALDDFDFTDKQLECFGPLLPMTDIIKIEVPALNGDFSPIMHIRKVWEGQLLAEKVEDQPTYAICRRAGIELFQGYYFARPEIISGVRYDPEAEDLLFVMSNFRDNLEMDELEALFKPRGALVVSLLSYINSASLSHGNQINSLRQALGLLGRKQIYQWLVLLLAAKSGRQTSQSAHVDDAILHASLCESIAKELNPKWSRPETDRAYLCGMLSRLPALLKAEPLALFERLRLSPDISLAILEHQGPLGFALEWAEKILSVEHRWEEALPINKSKINQFLDLAWATSAKTRSSSL